MEFRHMLICVETADLQRMQALFVVNSIKLHLTAFKHSALANSSPLNHTNSAF